MQGKSYTEKTKMATKMAAILLWIYEMQNVNEAQIARS